MLYRRYFQPGYTYFITMVAHDRSIDTFVRNIHLLRHAYRKVKRKRPFTLIACVVLPDHIHMLVKLPPDQCDMPGLIKELKVAFSKQLPKREALTESRVKRGERGVWQRRYWEHQIRDQEDLNNHIKYIHSNPIKHGLVDYPEEWPYSSIHKFKKSTL